VIHRLPIIIEREWLKDVSQYLKDKKFLERVLNIKDEKKLKNISIQGAYLSAVLDKLSPINLAIPKSHCPNCKNKIKWLHNIPIFSWLFLGGVCSKCKTKINIKYPIIELLNGIIYFLIISIYRENTIAIVYCLAASILLAAACIDFETTWLPDSLTLPLIGLGLISASQNWGHVTLEDAALGALWGYISLWSISTIYFLIRGRQGMAEGDFKLLSGLGALLGWKALFPIILTSSLLGSLFGLFLITFKGHKGNDPIPFGPYLVVGGFISMLAGEQIFNFFWFLGFL
jgi:leader peptidase (prepilin peptidase)/N-methyltransferase